MNQIEVSLLGVAVTALALSIGFLTYVLSRGLLPLTPSAKLWDRVYELDKLVLAYPEIFVLIMKELHRTTPFFYADPPVPRDKCYYQMKAMVYFHLNVFEEIFLTTEGAGGWIARQFERAGWDEYIFRKMRHPLIREVFDREAEQIYPGNFTKFIRKNWEQVLKPPPDGPF